MTSETLAHFKCPSCGADMEHGYIAGHWFRLRWVERPNTKTVFAGSPLRRGMDLWNSPSLEALRCRRCKVGLFRFDY